MKISIITVCYNRVATIREAIESVLKQDYQEIEYIVVDGESTDGTLDIIHEYKDKLSVLVSEPDFGMYEAINKGIRLATGEVVGLVHSDDVLWDAHVISDIVRQFEETSADIIYGDGIYVDSKDTTKIKRRWKGGRYSRLKVKLGWLPLHPTCYIRREVMLKNGLYDESYKIAADTELLVRYFLDNLTISYYPRNIIRMRLGGLSTDKGTRRLMWKEDIRLYKEHGFCGVPTKLMKMIWKIPQLIC